MKDVLRVVLVDPSDATREPLRNMLLGVESVWLEAECSRYEFFFDVAAGNDRFAETAAAENILQPDCVLDR